MLPGPSVHADLASAAAFASAHKDAASFWVQVALGKGERLADPQPGGPEQNDQRSSAPPGRMVPGAAHHRDDLPDRRRVRRIAPAFIAWRAAAVKASHGRRATGDDQRHPEAQK